MEAILIYSAAYAVMNLGAFLVIDLVGEDTKSFNGLIRTSPGVALSMGVFMASLVGIPPFSGFFGKAWIILAGAQSGSVLVYVVVGALVVNSVLSVPYYRHYPQHVLRGTGRAREGRRRSREVLRVRPRLATTLFGLSSSPSALVQGSGLL